MIVANPPYIRIQNMQIYSPQEVAYYQNPLHRTQRRSQDNFDKYALFIERALTLVQHNRPDWYDRAAQVHDNSVR